MENILYINNTEDQLKFTNSGDKLEIEGYCCHFDRRNLNGEITHFNSFDTFFSAYQKGTIKPKINVEHDNNRIIGGIDDIDRDTTGLYIVAHINKGIPYVSDWLIPNIEAGDINSFSSEGFPVGGYDSIVFNDKDQSYTVLDFMLTAVAIVAHPADTKAEFTVKNYLNTKPTDKEVEEEVKKSKWYLFV